MDKYNIIIQYNIPSNREQCESFIFDTKTDNNGCNGYKNCLGRHTRFPEIIWLVFEVFNILPRIKLVWNSLFSCQKEPKKCFIIFSKRRLEGTGSKYLLKLKVTGKYCRRPCLLPYSRVFTNRAHWPPKSTACLFFVLFTVPMLVLICT